LCGYADELEVGDPALLASDVGPVIGPAARDVLESYVADAPGRVLYRKRLDERHGHGTFVPPTIIELADARALDREVFGPVLHVVRYRAEAADELVAAVNASGFGLTLGVHTRIDSCARFVAARARDGTVYETRNMIGAQVGVQPFGGMGLSGTGPKAGGPHYVPRFGFEQTVTTNTAAVGGNATLLSLDADAATPPAGRV
jgi:RHH-type proline utilization regulon transcriptional repressor/proline dehydrogenase/delta 1-pyrroline-5-carboxylate dehydrogenase